MVASPPTIRIARPGSGEGLAPDQPLGQAELGADGADLVLEQRPQRLDELEPQVVRQAADVVVGLDRRRARAPAGLDHVGVQGALHQEARPAPAALPASASLAASSSNTRMNSAPIALRLASGSTTPWSFSRKRDSRVDGHERHLEGVAERPHDLLALVLAHQAVVDEHARQLLADRAVHEQRRHRGVHAAGQAADHAAVPHLLADPANLFLDDRRRRPRLLAAAHLRQEARQDLLAVGRVHDLGVELDPVDRRASAILDGRHRRAARGGQRREARRRLVDGVAVGHPARLLARHPLSSTPGVGHVQVRAAELPHLGLLDAPAERVHQQLHPVADADHRDAELQQAGDRVAERRPRTPTRARPRG